MNENLLVKRVIALLYAANDFRSVKKRSCTKLSTEGCKKISRLNVVGVLLMVRVFEMDVSKIRTIFVRTRLP